MRPSQYCACSLKRSRNKVNEIWIYGGKWARNCNSYGCLLLFSSLAPNIKDHAWTTYCVALTFRYTDNTDATSFNTIIVFERCCFCRPSDVCHCPVSSPSGGSEQNNVHLRTPDFVGRFSRELKMLYCQDCFRQKSVSGKGGGANPLWEPFRRHLVRSREIFS